MRASVCRESQFSFLKTSISRKHAYRVLHSRFPPFGFVLQPVWSEDHVLHELWRTSGRLRPRRFVLGSVESEHWPVNFPRGPDSQELISESF